MQFICYQRPLKIGTAFAEDRVPPAAGHGFTLVTGLILAGLTGFRVILAGLTGFRVILAGAVLTGFCFLGITGSGFLGFTGSGVLGSGILGSRPEF